MNTKIKGKDANLDCHGVITLSSGPPISIIFFNFINPALNSSLLFETISLFIKGKNSL